MGAFDLRCAGVCLGPGAGFVGASASGGGALDLNIRSKLYTFMSAGS